MDWRRGNTCQPVERCSCRCKGCKRERAWFAVTRVEHYICRCVSAANIIPELMDPVNNGPQTMLRMRRKRGNHLCRTKIVLSLLTTLSIFIYRCWVGRPDLELISVFRKQ